MGNGTVLYIGYTAGAGSNEQPPPDWSTGWVTAYQRTGAGGKPYATCTKVFAATNDLTGTWANAQGAIANNGSVPLLPILVIQAAVPTSSALQTFIHALPAGQKVAFQWQSEVEGTGSGYSGSTFLSTWATFSANLNTALAALGGGFYNRTNFPMITSALMSYYSANPGSVAFIPPASQVDAYGADFYQHIGGTENVGLQNDPRYQGYIQAVHKVAGTNVQLAFPEYGIMINGGYSSSGETAREALLAKDYAYMTGSGRPSGTKPVLAWNYWYQWNLKAGNVWTFPDTSGSETVAQASATITQWQTMVANAGPPGSVTVTVTNPGLQTSGVGHAITPLTISATDSAGNPLTFSATGLPPTLAISSAGVITGTPTTAGSYSVTVTAHDSVANVSGTASFTWQVSTNTITIADPGAQSSGQGISVSLPMHATDSGGLALTWTISGQPTGLGINASTGLISGTPTAAGSFSATVGASDSTGAHAADTFAWTITTNTISVTNPGAQHSTVGSPVTLAIVASDSNSFLNSTLVYTASGLPAGLGINASTGHITGTPSTPATSAVTVTVTDSTGAFGTAGFAWVVSSAGPDAITVVNPGAQAAIAHLAITSLQIQAVSSAGLPLTYSAGGTLPSGLSINSSTGVITGTPTSAGTSSVTITASDSTPTSGSATFSWVVANAVVSVTDIGDQTNYVGDSVSIQMNASDTGSFSVTWGAGGTLPAGLSISSGGLITGSVTTATIYSVTITGTDSHSNTGTDVLTWTVHPPLVTVINPGSQVNNVGDTVSLQMTAIDSDSLTLSYAANGTLPAGLSINASTGRITGSPTTPATYPVTITVTDTGASAGQASFTWIVAPSLSTLVASITSVGGTDSFGNNYQPGATFGVAGVSQTNIDLTGNITLSDDDGSPVIQLSPDLQAILGYADPAAPGALAFSLAPSVGGSDRYGNAFPLGALLGMPLSVPEGSNARMGTATLNGTTAVTVATTAVTAKSRIFLTIQTPGGTPASPYVSAITAGVSFAVKSTGGSDTSTVAWFLIDHT